MVFSAASKMAERYHRASRDGNLDILREATRKDCNKADEDGMTPTIWAAYHGNLQALRMIVGRGGGVDVYDYLGNTALHHAARNGHMNCVSYLVSYGINIWSMDNNNQTALEVAGLHDRPEIVKFLDDAATEQLQLHKKVVEKLKIKALENVDRNVKVYEKLQDEARRRMEKEQKRLARESENLDTPNGAVNAPREGSKGTMKKLFNTIRGRGNKPDTVKSAGPRMYSEHFSGTTSHRGRGGVQRGIYKKDQDFRVSEMDQSGKRTVRSMQGLRRDMQIMYVSEQNGHNGLDHRDNKSEILYTHSDPELSHMNGDSGIVSDDYEDGAEPGVFNRPGFGNLTFLHRPMGVSHLMELPANKLENGDEPDAGVSGESTKHTNGESDSIGSAGTLARRVEKLPWSEEEVETLDDEDEETEYTALELFLAAHNLTEFIPVFTKEKVDFEALLLLSEDDLVQMGLPLGPRRKIKEALSRRKDVIAQPGQVMDTHL